MARRATVFEENPFLFMNRIKPQSTDVCAAGHRSDWSRRSLLAIAKLHSRITPATKAEDFAGILLEKDPPDTDKADFLEVHFYGSVPRSAIELVSFLPEAVSQPGWELLIEMLAGSVSVKPVA